MTQLYDGDIDRSDEGLRAQESTQTLLNHRTLASLSNAFEPPT